MSECTHNCETCKANCADRKEKTDFRESPHEMSSIGKVIGIVSGKGGVGKSLVTSLCAVLAQRAGYSAAIMDADITGPSIPKMFGIRQKAEGSEMGLFPVSSKTGIKIMSTNLLLDNETDPVIWRGPVIAGLVKQFWTDVIWSDVDFLFVDMPPGTGDVPLTVFQTIPVDGIIVVASPQELVSMIVGKAIKMAAQMDIPVLGLVENMSYVKCPDCGKEIKVFGESRADEIAAKNGTAVLGRIPFDPKLAAASDAGTIELFDGDWLDGVIEKLTGEN